MEDRKRRRGRKAPGALEMVNILLKVGVKDRAFLPSCDSHDGNIVRISGVARYAILEEGTARDGRGRERERARNVTEISCGYRRAKASFA